MTSGPKAIAVYTTVHPGTLPYLREWHASILSQSRQDFDLWVGVDDVSNADLRRSLDKSLHARLVRAEPGDTPARLRERAIEAMLDQYEGVVFIDSDDVASPDRVARAAEALDDADVVSCSLDLIDAGGRSLGAKFGPLVETADLQVVRDAWLLEGNVVGLGNSAFRTDCLRRCLSVPRDCTAMDWLLGTRAWLGGAKLVYDPHSGGLYRRHSECVTPIRPPFTLEAVRSASRIASDHFSRVGQHSIAPVRERKSLLDRRRDVVVEFAERISSSSEVGNEYVCALNAQPVTHMWWSCVAHPALEKIWRRA